MYWQLSQSRKMFTPPESSEYLSIYDTKMNHIFPDRIFFFPSREDAPYGASAFQKNFLKIWYTAFPEKLGNGVSIRSYDLRHHFAYANMNRWLKEGKDVNVMLPYLMRYIGHQDIEHTLYYYGKQNIMVSKLATLLKILALPPELLYIIVTPNL